MALGNGILFDVPVGAYGVNDPFGASPPNPTPTPSPGTGSGAGSGASGNPIVPPQPGPIAGPLQHQQPAGATTGSTTGPVDTSAATRQQQFMTDLGHLARGIGRYALAAIVLLAIAETPLAPLAVGAAGLAVLYLFLQGKGINFLDTLNKLLGSPK